MDKRTLSLDDGSFHVCNYNCGFGISVNFNAVLRFFKIFCAVFGPPVRPPPSWISLVARFRRRNLKLLLERLYSNWNYCVRLTVRLKHLSADQLLPLPFLHSLSKRKKSIKRPERYKPSEATAKMVLSKRGKSQCPASSQSTQTPKLNKWVRRLNE